ncbi:glutamate--cysteine ligase [Streptomyces sp. NPDC023327]|uniref:carboxylate-amine ligase n=1 Tax=Streptomyces sp. NPDC023327 TaxID=3157088 RepID=UPI0033E5F9CE
MPSINTPVDGTTMGVEEEFLLAHPETGAAVPQGPQAVARVGQDYGPSTPGAGPRTELLQTMVESATGVCTTLTELHHHLATARIRLATSAAHTGARLLATASPPLPPTAPRSPVTDTQHYDTMHALYGALVTDQEICSCHVHIGVADRDTGAAVLNHLRPWLPTLLALSANSPFLHGQDTGYASWRTVSLSRWPAVRVPPRFEDADHYDRTLAELHRGGLLAISSDAHWLARLSNHLPTVEVRVADVCRTADEAVLQAGLTRALVRTALHHIAEGRPAPDLSETSAAAALWTAARHGLDGPALDPITGDRTHAPRRLHQLFTHIKDAATETGDLDHLRDLARQSQNGGTGAIRQRLTHHAHGPAGLLDLLTQPRYQPTSSQAHQDPLAGRG